MSKFYYLLGKGGFNLSIDYVYKSKILKNPKLLHLEKLVSKTIWLNKNYYNKKTGELIMSLDDAKAINFNLYSNDEWKEARKINHAYYHRSVRLKNRLEKFFNKGNCIFLTLTFNDIALKKLSAYTRKKYVKTYLKSCSNDYVANIDYGGKGGREHYHAVVVANKVNNKLWNDLTFGSNVNFEKCRTNVNDKTRLSKYVAKLTNHAIKETTKRNAIIYSR